jgi:hypothetical protein
MENKDNNIKPHLQSLQKDNHKTKTSFHLTIPKITSGAMAISVTAQRPAPICLKCHFGTSNSHVFLSSNSVIPD